MNTNKIMIAGAPLMHKTPKGDDGYLYTAEEVYQMLIKYAEKASKSLGEGTFDDHSKWEGLSKEERENLDQMINEAIEMISNSNNVSNIPGELLREFNELKNPTVNWRELLNDVLSYEVCDYSFSPPDRRYQGDFFLPDFNEVDLKEETVHFFIDTSGSISKVDLTKIVSEINGALIQYNGKVKCKISYFDTLVYEGEEVSNTTELKKIQPKGNGGTSFVNLFKYIDSLEEKPKCVIVLTDGYAAFPKRDYSLDFPVIWILSTEDVTPPWGRYTRYK